MDPLCRTTAPGARFPFRRLALTVAAGLLFGSSSYAATFGHSRIASAAGEPLLIMVPVSDLSAQDIQSLSAQVAPAADWAQAGLVPPVALSDLRVSVEAGVQPATRVLRVQSSQALEGTLADLLIDVHTASGQQRYQVTLLARGPAQSPRPVTSTTTPKSSAASADAVGQKGAHSSARRVPEGTIAVRKGDNMFAIARRHAVDDVTVYQMMMALQRTNPEAFIEKNINLVKAGERLTMPGMDELLALSDHDARREFQAQAAAFAEYRARHGGKQGASLTQADQGTATQGGITQAEGAVAAPVAQGDHLSLSGGAAQGKGGDAAQAQADTRTAQGKAVADAQGRVSQLEENVGHLSDALKAQGEAARSAVLGGAKDISNSLADVADAVSQASRDAVAQAGGATGADSSGAALASGAASASPAASTPSTASTSSAGNSAGASGAASTAPGSSTATGSSTVSGASSASSSSSGGSPVVAAQGGASAAGTAPGNADSLLQPISPKAEETVSWLQEHLLGVMTGLLALIVLVIAWLLRRANGARDDVYAGAQVTEAMVKEKLQNIDLDLTPGAGETKRRDG